MTRYVDMLLRGQSQDLAQALLIATLLLNVGVTWRKWKSEPMLAKSFALLIFFYGIVMYSASKSPVKLQWWYHIYFTPIVLCNFLMLAHTLLKPSFYGRLERLQYPLMAAAVLFFSFFFESAVNHIGFRNSVYDTMENNTWEKGVVYRIPMDKEEGGIPNQVAGGIGYHMMRRGLEYCIASEPYKLIRLGRDRGCENYNAADIRSFKYYDRQHQKKSQRSETIWDEVAAVRKIDFISKFYY